MFAHKSDDDVSANSWAGEQKFVKFFFILSLLIFGNKNNDLIKIYLVLL